ncbi:MAG: superoxide dismutase [Fe] [Lentimicrobiaceae bacterium]|jgi:Fe-Mn family superoxide dismutase|nr:superoxide dismutase [Fe] [Lentimicrobiaceae bacterium]
MLFELPSLPYAMDALEPYISKNTIEFHYGKHHQAYVTNLNKLVPGTEFENATLEEIVKRATGGIFNNGAQVWNHTFYWSCLAPNAGGEPSGLLADRINRDFGSFATFKEKFSAAAATLFGSGWAWLVKNADGKLEIIQESNAGNPLRNGFIPLLTCDVWEHAYYLDKQNRRPDYISDFWNLINWNTVAQHLK